MLYAALTFWLFVIVFSAWGVHSLWSALVKPRVVNGVLLPGTLVAQLGHVLGLLVTGNAVRNAELMSDDDKGSPKADAPERHRIPVFGSIIVGLLPLVACAVCLYGATRLWGGSVMRGLSGGAEVLVSPRLPSSLPGVWDLMRDCVTLMQNLLSAVVNSDLPNGWTMLFLYLAVCLTVRMAPLEGNRRGAIGAIALAGMVIAVAATLVPAAEEFVISSWPVLSLAVAMLLFLLLTSLIVTGIVGLMKVLAGGADARGGGGVRRRATPAVS